MELPTTLAALHTLLLDIGAPCWASGRTAAALHGFDGFHLAPPFHVTILRGRNLRRQGATIHTTFELPPIDRAERQRLPVTSPTRTLIDLARTERPRRLTDALDSALRDGLTTEEHLHERIAALRSQGRYGIPTLFDAIEGSETTRGGHSWLERRFLELLAQAGLPRPDPQQVVAQRSGRLVRVDLRFPGSPVVVELLGYRYHRTKAQMQIDAERMNVMLLAGLVPLQFTYQQVVETPDACVAVVRAALRSSRERSV